MSTGIRFKVLLILIVVAVFCSSGSALAREETPAGAPRYSGELFTESERVFFGQDCWRYTSSSLAVLIDKVYYEDCQCVCFIAHIYTKNGVNFDIAAYTEDAIEEGKRGQPVKIARSHKSVYAQNGDYFWEENNYNSGIVIRDGIVYKDKVKESMMAFFPDGAMRVFRPGEITPQQLLDEGVTQTMSFGPILVEDGEACADIMEHPLAYRNPRSAIGMVEPGHYVGILVDGRQKASVGMEFDRLAEEFINQGCTVAYNLDGGQSTAMVFMGVQLNTHENDSIYPLQRKVPEMYVIGQTGMEIYEYSDEPEDYAGLFESFAFAESKGLR